MDRTGARSTGARSTGARSTGARSTGARSTGTSTTLSMVQILLTCSPRASAERKGHTGRDMVALPLLEWRTHHVIACLDISWGCLCCRARSDRSGHTTPVDFVCSGQQCDRDAGACHRLTAVSCPGSRTPAVLYTYDFLFRRPDAGTTGAVCPDRDRAAPAGMGPGACAEEPAAAGLVYSAVQYCRPSDSRAGGLRVAAPDCRLGHARPQCAVGERHAGRCDGVCAA